MRVLVCGGRDYGDRRAVEGGLEKLWHIYGRGEFVVIQGGATGADYLARQWCVMRQIPYETYPADWKHLGRAAGPLRNARMLDEGRPDLVIAFPGHKGTADMVRRARAANVEVVEVAP